MDFAKGQIGALILTLLSVFVAQPSLAAQQATFTVTTDTQFPAGFKDPTGKHKAEVPEHSLKTTKLTIAPTWLSYGDANNYEVIDFTKKRLISIDVPKKTFRSSSLYALAYFKVAESQNRQMLGQLLSKANINADSMGSDFETESSFGLVVPGKPKQNIAIQSNGATKSFSLKGKNVASYTLSDKNVAPENEKTYQRFLTYYARVHPQIATELHAKNVFVSQLQRSGKSELGASETVNMKLVEVRNTGSTTLPMPVGFTEEHEHILEPVYKAVAALGPTPQFPTKTEVETFNQQAIKDGRPLDALMEVCEVSWVDPALALEQMRAIAPIVKENAQCKIFLMAMSQPKKEQMKQVEDAVKSLNRDRLQRAEALDVVLANDYFQVEQPERARALMIKAISKNPLLIGPYVDLWQILCAQFDMGAAWSCIDIAKTLSPNNARFSQVTGLEAQLEKDFPQFF